MCWSLHFFLFAIEAKMADATNRKRPRDEAECAGSAPKRSRSARSAESKQQRKDEAEADDAMPDQDEADDASDDDEETNNAKLKQQLSKFASRERKKRDARLADTTSYRLPEDKPPATIGNKEKNGYKALNVGRRFGQDCDKRRAVHELVQNCHDGAVRKLCQLKTAGTVLQHAQLTWRLCERV